MTKENTAVAKQESTAVDKAELAGMFDLKENMAGVEARLPQIKIIHQAQMFEFPDGEKHATFRGTILDISRVNAWWEQSFDETGGGVPPDCFSMDGVTPDPFSGKRQNKECRSCGQNAFGSDGGRGKACKNMKRVHILLEGEMLPHRLTIPPSNLKAIDLYVSLLTSKGIPYQLVTTEFALNKAKNKDGITYAEIQMKNVGVTDSLEEARRVKELRNEFLGVMRGQEIKVDEEL